MVKGALLCPGALECLRRTAWCKDVAQALVRKALAAQKRGGFAGCADRCPAGPQKALCGSLCTRGACQALEAAALAGGRG